MRKLFSALIATSLLMTANLSFANEKPGEGIEVLPLHSTISEEAFQTMVLNEALRQLGYDVKEIKQVDYSTAYTAISNGDATFMPVNWFPLHNDMYANAGGDDVFYRGGAYIKGAVQGYLIDKKTADKYNITSIDQFKDAKIAKLFELRDRINHNQGQYAAIIADTIVRYNEGQSIFYYTWTPYWVSGKLVPGKDVVWLEVPYSANPNGTDTALPNGQNYGFAINSQRIVANKEFASNNPAAAKLFEVAKLPINDVSAENMLIADGEDSQQQIRQHALNWIKINQVAFNGWLTAARDAAE
jgi:glycine betaine/proline transport system substrate-binding protein